MLLKIVDEGKFRDITIGEGEMFLLPREWSPFSCPRRRRLTVKVSSEHAAQPGALRGHHRARHGAAAARGGNRCATLFVVIDVLTHCPRDGAPDRLRWYCKSGNHAKPTIIREETLYVTDLGTQLKPIIQNWQANEELRKCAECGAVAEAK